MAPIRHVSAEEIESLAIGAWILGTAPLNAECETRAAAILRQEYPDAAVTLSHELGRIGLLERENATLLNAALVGWRGAPPARSPRRYGPAASPGRSTSPRTTAP